MFNLICNLQYFSFTKDSFEQFVKSCSKTARLIFMCCKINLDSDIDLSGPTYNLSYLSFYCCHCQNSNWKTKSGDFEKIVKAIAQSGLKDSLKTINECGNIGVENVKKILKEFNLKHVSAVQESNSPLSS